MKALIYNIENRKTILPVNNANGELRMKESIKNNLVLVYKLLI